MTEEDYCTYMSFRYHFLVFYIAVWVSEENYKLLQKSYLNDELVDEEMFSLNIR